ncbi:COG1470 family protein [Thermus islandicus]|uniref:COG1470 family protein n=1 Tax=Thermus islandicus TaxID=540988 RepID=UPI0003B7A6A1|nr:hypothetical protein [Thermus islandicus]
MKRLALGLNALFLALLPLALAQADLTLSPARLEFALPFGGSAEERVVLKNGLPREEALQVRLLPFALDPRGNVVESPKRNLCPHLEVAPTALVLPPGGSAEVRVRVKAPQGEGTLACLVVFSASPRPLERGGVRLSVRPELGLAVYLTLRGTERPAFRAKVGGAGESLPLLLENPGNVLERVSGEARVFDGEGREVARLPLEAVPVFPGGYRELFLRPDPPLPRGRYRVALILEGAYGRYAAEGTWDVP